MSAMSTIWARRLIAGTQEFSRCPEKYKNEVIMLLKEAVKKGQISTERYQEITGSPYEA